MLWSPFHSLPVSAAVLSKFWKPQLCLGQNVAQGWSRNRNHQQGHIPSLSGMKETKDGEYRGKFSLYRKRHGDDLSFFKSLYYSNLSTSVCLSINGRDYALLTSPNHQKTKNHCINPNIVLTNSICQGTFWTEVFFQ